ncbi:cation:proton antiporter [Streptomyces sp. NPDC088115]|uniref:cation:proton antiporter n=1 Tax=Streptomyces sp. NPDC088115 TaxID=3365824 RepID=UPI0037FC3CB1
MHLLTAVAQLGVLLLVAITGAHIDLGLIRRKGRAIGWVSAGSVLLPLALGIGLGFLLPGSLIAPSADRSTFALFIGVAIAVSALPVIAKTLLDMRLLHRDVGQLIVGAAAISDIVGWLLLSVVSAMVVSGAGPGMILQTVGYLFAALAIAVLVVRPMARGVLRHTERSGQPGVSVAAIVVLITLSAAGTQALDMEPILGAFLCGVVISSLGSGRPEPEPRGQPKHPWPAQPTHAARWCAIGWGPGLVVAPSNISQERDKARLRRFSSPVTAAEPVRSSMGRSDMWLS